MRVLRGLRVSSGHDAFSPACSRALKGLASCRAQPLHARWLFEVRGLPLIGYAGVLPGPVVQVLEVSGPEVQGFSSGFSSPGSSSIGFWEVSVLWIVALAG
ncbi:hypothetical protein OIU78_027284 [Salix suchowensis]|nr:hypothetical protein OIU78_027284 [Salix suchowensis]